MFLKSCTTHLCIIQVQYHQNITQKLEGPSIQKSKKILICFFQGSSIDENSIDVPECDYKKHLGFRVVLNTKNFTK